MAENEEREIIEENIPDADTCQKLIDSFASTTQADQALSQFFLQEAGWNIEDAINSFYDGQEKPPNGLSKNSSDVVVVYESSNDDPKELKLTTVPPSKFSFLSWNIDGLDEHNLKKRTKGVAKLIEMGRYDIVFLQEVVPVTFEYLKTKLPQYEFLCADNIGYFCVTLLSKYTVRYDSHMKHDFPNSQMNRNILEVRAHIGDVHFKLLNTHLESTAEFAKARVDQLKNAMRVLTSNPDCVSILGGDLNIRDKEMAAVGIPKNTCDLWVECGSRPECQYTWDLQRNSNKSFPGKWQPRLRFDRALLHQTTNQVTPRHFGLEGIQKICGTQSFPSDHWGIQVYFHINKSTNVQSVRAIEDTPNEEIVTLD